MQIRSIQVLRAIAASAVVYLHAYERTLSLWPENAGLLKVPHLASLGNSGVDLFFVLSGFLMAHLHREQFGQPGASQAFFWRRLARIAPIYWILIALTLLGRLYMSGLYSHDRSLDWPWALGNFLFIPWPDSHGLVDRAVIVGWTLDYEMYFYVLFALALFFRTGLAWLAGVMLLSVVAGIIFAPTHPWPQLLTSPMLLEFLAGMGIAQIALRRVPAYAGALAVVIGCALLALSVTFPEVNRSIRWGIPMALIVLGSLWLRKEFRGGFGNMLVAAGDASYSIYLTQAFTLPAVAALLVAIGIAPSWGFVAILFATGIAGGMIFSRFVEIPIYEAMKPAAHAALLDRQVLR